MNLCWEVGIASAEKLSNVFPAQNNSAHRDPSVRLGEELVTCRRRLDQKFAEKQRREKRVKQLNARLEVCRTKRQLMTVELSQRKTDVQHSLAQLEFVRQQIESIENDVAHGWEEPAPRAEGTQQLQVKDHDLGMVHHEAFWEDRHNAQELIRQIKVISRKKLDLQAQHLVLVESQRQAEQNKFVTEGFRVGAE